SAHDAARRVLPAFPTRRSSDLRHRRARRATGRGPRDDRLRRSRPARVGAHRRPRPPRRGEPGHGRAADAVGPGPGPPGGERASAAADRPRLFGFRLGWRAVRRMPARAAYALIDRIAVVTHRRNTSSVQRLRANYARVRPELGPAALDALTREGMRSYLRYWCDAFPLPDLDPDELARRVRVEG